MDSIRRERKSRMQLHAEVPFLDAIPEDVQCQICLSAAIEASVTEECGHLFCRDCIETAMDRRKECPVCRQPLLPGEVRKDVRAQRKVMGLTTACYHRRGGCAWKGAMSDLERHSEKCDFAAVKCPFAQHGCDAVVTRKSLQEHIASGMAAHLLLLGNAVTRLSDENLALQQELELLQREESRFVWVIPHFEAKKGPLYSKKFSARGHAWYLGVDFEGPDQHAGVYLFAEGHTRRVDFKLLLYNQDAERDKVHQVNDWAPDYKGKGWGPLKFIDRAAAASAGFLSNGCVRIGVELEGEPFD